MSVQGNQSHEGAVFHRTKNVRSDNSTGAHEANDQVGAVVGAGYDGRPFAESHGNVNGERLIGDRSDDVGTDASVLSFGHTQIVFDDCGNAPGDGFEHRMLDHGDGAYGGGGGDGGDVPTSAVAWEQMTDHGVSFARHALNCRDGAQAHIDGADVGGCNDATADTIVHYDGTGHQFESECDVVPENDQTANGKDQLLPNQSNTNNVARQTWELACPGICEYDSPAIAQFAMNRFAKAHGYALVVKRSINDQSGSPRRVLYACDRHGAARKNHVPRPGNIPHPSAGSRRCGCAMVINLMKLKGSNKWTVDHRGGETIHNHAPSTCLTSHPIVRRGAMSDKIRESIATDSETGTSAAQTLARLLEEDTRIPITPRDIYNERQRAVRDKLDGSTWIVHLLRQLSDDEFFMRHKLDSSCRISHLFFALCEAVAVFKENPDVVLMDCTYRTNTFDMPLLNMVGVTGMNTTIQLAQAFMRGEEQSDYEWALSQLKVLLKIKGIECPQVIFVDRDLALLNALESVFPHTPVLLCLWDIVKDVETHARLHGFPQVVDHEKSKARVPK